MAEYFSDPAVGGTGATYTDDRDPQTGLADYGYVTRLIPMFASIIAIANWVKARATEIAGYAASALNAPGTLSTSTTSLTIGTGSRTLTIQTGKALAKGQTVVIANTASPGNQMLGYITDYNSTTGVLQVEVQSVQGSGTASTWTVSLAATSAGGVPTNRTVSAGGIATGGGDLSANRTITVTAAAAADVRTKSDNSKALTAKAVADAAAWVALTDQANVAVDLNSGINFTLLIGGNRNLSAPTNATAGQSGFIEVTQDGTGGRTLTPNAAYSVAGGSLNLNAAPGGVTLLGYVVKVGGGSPVIRLWSVRF